MKMAFTANQLCEAGLEAPTAETQNKSLMDRKKNKKTTPRHWIPEQAEWPLRCYGRFDALAADPLVVVEGDSSSAGLLPSGSWYQHRCPFSGLPLVSWFNFNSHSIFSFFVLCQPFRATKKSPVWPYCGWQECFVSDIMCDSIFRNLHKFQTSGAAQHNEDQKMQIRKLFVSSDRIPCF